MEPKEAERLQALARYEILDSPPEAAFDDLTELAADVCEVPISLITFLDSQREWFKSKVGFSLQEVPRDNAFCAQTMLQTDVMVVPDASRDYRFSENPLVTGDLHIRFYAGFPLVTSDGHALGALCVLDSVPHELTPRQRQILRRIGHEVTQLLELRREVREKQHRNEQQTAELFRLQEQLVEETAKHKKAEEDLIRRERQLADAQRLAQLGSWEWDLSTDTVAWSDELYRIFGLRPGEFKATYEGYLERIHPEDREKTAALIKATLETSGSFLYEKRIVRSDGVIRTIFSSGEVILDEFRRPVRMVGFAQDITARKEMEEKLGTSVSLLNSILESTADGILAVDLAGKLQGYNQRFLEIWNVPVSMMKTYRDEIVLQRVLDQLENPEEFLTKVQDLYGHPEEDSFDTLRFKDGRILERFSRPQRCGEEIVGRVWSFRDVTERFRAVEILRQSEQRYRSLVIATSEVVWTQNAEGYVEEDSPSWRKFTGQSKEEMLGHGWMNAVYPEDRQKLVAHWSEVMVRGRIYELEHRVRRADGEWRYLLVRGVPIKDESGRVREWVGFCRDISARKKAEQALRDERDFSDALINSMPGIVYVLDHSGLNLRWNTNLENVTGYTPEEIRTMLASDFVPPEEREYISARVHKVFEEGEADAEIHLRSKDGRVCPYYCTGRLVMIRGEARLVGVGVDISEHKRAQEEIKKLNRELEDRVRERTRQLDSSNKELRSFSYTVSHDLKAPLRAIAGFAEAIADDYRGRLDEEHQLYLERIVQSASRMSRLIEDLLTYSRIGRAAVHLRPVALNELLNRLTDDFRWEIEAKGGRLTIEENMPAVNADVTLLNQVFSNLVQNAITYRKPDVPLELSITARTEADHVVICVSDNGIGIAPSHHERIFEVFQRLHSDEKYPGTGIGLANVKKAVELQGGSVWVESELGKGSCFCVRLQSA